MISTKERLALAEEIVELARCFHASMQIELRGRSLRMAQSGQALDQALLAFDRKVHG